MILMLNSELIRNTHLKKRYINLGNAQSLNLEKAENGFNRIAIYFGAGNEELLDFSNEELAKEAFDKIDEGIENDDTFVKL